MAAESVTKPWSVRISAPLFDDMRRHLFPGDDDEHGGVITAGIVETDTQVRLLAREWVPAADGVDYVPGQRGYRMLTSEFVARLSGRCDDERLVYLAVHCHPGHGPVSFSRDDLNSHERGYPALLDVTRGGPVGALVFSEDAVAGDIWTPGIERRSIDHAVVVGENVRVLSPGAPPSADAVSEMYDRHVRLFGDLGQQRLGRLKVGVVGAGGGGSLLVQMLARLGIGHLVVVDFDRVEPSNLPRIVGATRRDAGLLPLLDRLPPFRQGIPRLATQKVRVAERVARGANPEIKFDAVVGNVADDPVATLLRDTDVLFLATDSFTSRLVFNALVHQYLIPGYQIGAKVRVDPADQSIEEVYSVARRVLPSHGGGCLLCAGLIPASRLQDESLSPEQREAQRYVDSDAVHEPSVMTLNAVGAALAANDMMLMVTGLVDEPTRTNQLFFDGRRRTLLNLEASAKERCRMCSGEVTSIFARGDRSSLPTRKATSALS